MKRLIRIVLCFVVCVLTSSLWQAQDDHYKFPKANAAQMTENTQSIEEIQDSSIFDEFDNWTKQYLTGNLSKEHLRKGERLVLHRRDSLKRLIQISPKKAIERAVSPDIYNRLPAEITRHLEKRVNAAGDFIVQTFDLIESEKSVEPHTIREVIFGETKYTAFVYGRKTSMTTKFRTPLCGIILDGLMAVDENSVKKLQKLEYAAKNVDETKLSGEFLAAEVGGEIKYYSDQPELEKYIRDLADWEAKISPVPFGINSTETPGSSWTEGSKKVLVIRVDFPDRTGEPTDQSDAPLTETRSQNVISNAVNPFYISNSYNKTSIQNPVVTPVVRMPQAQSFYNGFNLNTVMLADARNAARAVGFETNDYDLDIIAFGFTPNLSFSGSAIIGEKGLFLNGFFDFKTIAHELGHNFGLLHANLWRTTDGTIIGTGANVEYGDAFDLMGGGASQLTHFSAGYKRRLDWLSDANVQAVTQSGVYRVYAFDSVNAPSGVHALKIRKDNAKDYWVEFRQLFTPTPSLMNGALIRWEFSTQNLRQTQILDMAPATTTLGDASLLVGQTFSDATSGISFTVLGKGNTVPESLDIQVNFNYSIAKGASFDFDGDNKSDIAVFRPENGAWYLNQSTQGFRAISWGTWNDKIVPAKFNFDRTTDIAVYRNGTWYVYNSFGGNPIIVQFGLPDDIPVPADYDSDGFAEMAVYRPSNGVWYLWNWVNQRFSAVQFGVASDKPVPADYDGDGKIDVAIYRPSTGEWWIQRSMAGTIVYKFGNSTDKPIQADYTGDGKADVAFFRPQTGEWFILRSENSSYYSFPFGTNGDAPSPGDYDGDGRTDAAVFRPSNNIWYVQRSASGTMIQTFGQTSDLPVPNAFVP